MKYLVDAQWPKPLRVRFAVVLGVALIAVLASLRGGHAQIHELEASTPAGGWGPLRVGDSVGIKDLGPCYELQVAPSIPGTGYKLRSIERQQGTTFLVLTPPEFLMAPGLVKEIWIPTTAVRSAVKR